MNKLIFNQTFTKGLQEHLNKTLVNPLIELGQGIKCPTCQLIKSGGIFAGGHCNIHGKQHS